MKFNSSRLWIPVGLFLLNLLVGLLFINEGLFHMDSVALAMAVEKTCQTGIPQPAVHGRYIAVIINSILYFPAYVLGRDADFTIRFSSLLFHALSIVAFFYFIKNIFKDQLQALFGALLLSFTPLYFNPNTYGKEHGMGLFFLLISFILVDRAIQKNSIGLIITACLANACAFAARESLVWTIPLFYLYVLTPFVYQYISKTPLFAGKPSPKLLIAFFLTHCISFAVIYFTFLGGVIQVEYTKGILRSMSGVAFTDMMDSMPIFVFVFLILGAITMFRDGKMLDLIFFLLWLMLFFVYGNNIWYTPRHLDAIMVPLYVFASYSLSKFFKISGIVISAVVVFCVSSMLLYLYPMLSFRHYYNGEKRLAEYVKLRTAPDALIITEDQFPFIEYYGHRKTVWLPINGTDATNDLFIRKVEQHLKQNKPVYYTDSPYLKGYEASSLYSIQQFFKLKLIGGVLIEDYHRPELRFRFAYQKLYKVSSRK